MPAAWTQCFLSRVGNVSSAALFVVGHRSPPPPRFGVQLQNYIKSTENRWDAFEEQTIPYPALQHKIIFQVYGFIKMNCFLLFK